MPKKIASMPTKLIAPISKGTAVEVPVETTPERKAEVVANLSAKLIAEMVKDTAAITAPAARKTSAHAGWTGFLTLGMLTFPVKTYTGTEEEKVSFNCVHQAEDGSVHKLNEGPMLCKACNKSVPGDQILKGYAEKENEYVTVSKDELSGCQVTSSDALEILEFVPADQIDSIYFSNTDFIAPGGKKASDLSNAANFFGLIRLAMVETNTVAIGKRVSRGRDQIVAIRPYGLNGMTIQSLLFENEIRNFNGWKNVPSEMDSVQVAAAVSLVKALTTDFTMENKVDSYLGNVKAMVAAKVAKVDAPTFVKNADPQESAGDIMSVLKASLAAAQGRKKA